MKKAGSTMQYKIHGYEPERLFQNFEDFSAVPRGSFRNEKISAFLVQFAEEHGLDVYQDDALNVIIKKPGQNGGEDKPPVILQGHMDMVCEKVKGCDHDFENEGIDMVVTDDGWLTANGTTLGGDDGIADAMMMTLLEDSSLAHPPLECVFTTDEEVGLLGAAALDYDKLDGRLMINLDSEDEGIATVSCAGGMDVLLKRPVLCEYGSGYVVSMEVTGLLGGHSGTDIGLERINAAKLLARAMHRALAHPWTCLSEFSAGSAGNAIPREGLAGIFTEREETADAVETELRELADQFYREISPVEPDIRVTVRKEYREDADYLVEGEGELLVDAILLSPNGVFHRDPSLGDFILTSVNLGIVSIEDDTAKLLFCPRSSVDSLMEELLDLLYLTAETFDFSVEESGQYPGWERVEDSRLVETMKKSYEELFGEELKVEGIHAGLECGLFVANLPGLDPVSIGPTMRGVHTPDEKMDLASCERTYRLVADVLARLSE